MIFFLTSHDKLNEKCLRKKGKKKILQKRNFYDYNDVENSFSWKAKIVAVNGNERWKKKSYRSWKWMQIFISDLSRWFSCVWHGVASLSPIKIFQQFFFLLQTTTEDKMLIRDNEKFFWWKLFSFGELLGKESKEKWKKWINKAELDFIAARGKKNRGKSH